MTPEFHLNRLNTLLETLYCGDTEQEDDVKNDIRADFALVLDERDDAIARFLKAQAMMIAEHRRAEEIQDITLKLAKWKEQQY